MSPSRLTLIFSFLAMVGVQPVPGRSALQIKNDNAQSVLYIEALNEKGEIVDHGTGFIVSHDGYVITTYHLAANGNTFNARVGARGGERYTLHKRGFDVQANTAILQLSEATSCWHAVTISPDHPKEHENLTALGFPGADGLAIANITLSDTSDLEETFYRSTGLFQESDSGGPVFDDEGKVVAFVGAETLAGAKVDDLVSLAPALSLLAKRGMGTTNDQSRCDQDTALAPVVPKPERNLAHEILNSMIEAVVHGQVVLGKKTCEALHLD